MGLRAPERLTAEHDLDGFTCRHPSLAKWLKENALKNQASGASNCFVVCDDRGDGRSVVGFYALAAGSVSQEVTPRSMRRNMPDPIPVALLGRLAVHSDHEGKGIGGGLLADATKRCLAAAAQGPGIAAILCHAIDDGARAFYLHNGFVQFPVEALTVMLPLRGLVAALRGSS